jgi:hypothetical protein
MIALLTCGAVIVVFMALRRLDALLDYFSRNKK